jgi:hypothetical protein
VQTASNLAAALLDEATTIRSVSPDLPRNELTDENNLLIEAVSLLVQRQRETESWVAEQVFHTDERAAATEQRYAELEARLLGIEERLARLTHEAEPGPAEGVDEKRLARLREQLEGLKSGEDGRPARSPSALPAAPVTHAAPAKARPVGAPTPPQHTVHQPRSVGFLDLLGATPQDRFGLLIMGVGAVAVVYAALSLLRIG